MFPDVFLDFVLLKIQLPQYVDPNSLFCNILSLPLWISFFFFSFFFPLFPVFFFFFFSSRVWRGVLMIKAARKSLSFL